MITLSHVSNLTEIESYPVVTTTHLRYDASVWLITTTDTQVWNASTGLCSSTLQGHTGGVWCLEMKDDLIVSGSTDRTLRVWNANNGDCNQVSIATLTISTIRDIFNMIIRFYTATAVQFDVWQWKMIWLCPGHVIIRYDCGISNPASASMCSKAMWLRFVASVSMERKSSPAPTTTQSRSAPLSTFVPIFSNFDFQIWDPFREGNSKLLYTLQGHQARLFDDSYYNSYYINHFQGVLLAIWRNRRRERLAGHKYNGEIYMMT